MKRLIQWLTKPFRKHIHNYNASIIDIAMENNTNYIILQCKCGHVKADRVHRESETYNSFESKKLKEVLYKNTADTNHLEFIYDRLINVYGENPNYDYMIKLKEISQTRCYYIINV